MENKFKTIGLIGRHRSSESVATILEIQQHLLKKKFSVIIEEDTAKLLSKTSSPIYGQEEFAKHCDLAIVIGGDGSILNAAKLVVDHKVPVLGINRGRLGFLTDIHPHEFTKQLDEVLSGNYFSEKRFLLQAKIIEKNKVVYENIALNDVVLLPGDYAHMIEFEIHINDQLVCIQRADGQVIATPTGSTAYALSGGGPILHPQLQAIVLVPMFSHTLSARPVVVSSTSKIVLFIPKENETSPHVSCDGQKRVAIKPGSSLHIEKKTQELILLHPKNYQYFETLRNKLHWQTKL